MFKILGKLDKSKKYYVAFSGGKDSVAFTNYLLSRNFKITLLHFNHNLSEEDKNSFEFTTAFAKKHSLELIVDFLNHKKKTQESPEDFQRIYRYKFLDKFIDAPVILCHNLNDNCENWVMHSLKGQPKLIPYARNNCIRPFMLNSSETILNYLTSNSLEYYEDQTNQDLNIPRNYTRHILMEHVLKINEGFFNMIKRKIIKKYLKECNDF